MSMPTLTHGLGAVHQAERQLAAQVLAAAEAIDAVGTTVLAAATARLAESAQNAHLRLQQAAREAASQVEGLLVHLRGLAGEVAAGLAGEATAPAPAREEAPPPAEGDPFDGRIGTVRTAEPAFPPTASAAHAEEVAAARAPAARGNGRKRR